MTTAGAGPSPEEYTQRLVKARESRWKRLLGVQIPYRWNVRRVAWGRVLDVGCGIGRNLEALSPQSVGVDINPHSVAVARNRGLNALTTDEFRARGAEEASFDALLFAHVLEHMSSEEGIALVADYLPHLRWGGRVVVIVPQEAGFASDPTHVEPVDEPEILRIAAPNGLETERIYSFPLPRPAGRWFKYNETVGVLRKSRPS